MAMKMARLFGGEARAAENTDFDAPTTQVRMGIHSPEGYDPPSTMSVMDQLRTASNAASAPPKSLVIFSAMQPPNSPTRRPTGLASCANL